MRISRSSFPVLRISQIKSVFVPIIFVLLIFKLSGCEENPSFLGRDLLPSADNLEMKIDTSVVISAYTITGKDITTSLNSFFPAGSLKDSIFGFSTAGIVAQYQPVFLTPPSTIITSIDSIFITLTIAKAYGDSITPQTIRAYELTEELRRDTFYYSNFDVTGKYNPNELGSAVFSPQDSFIRIKITNVNYHDKFFVQVDSIYRKLEDFVKQFNGIYFKTDNVAEGGGYTLISLDAQTSVIDMYYNQGSIFNMYFSSSVARFSVYTHDYSAYPVFDHINLPGSNDSILFIEGLAGLSVRLNFSQLDTFLLNRKVAINKAALIIPVDFQAGNIPESKFPPRLMLFEVEDNGDYDYLRDFKISDPYFNGYYDKAKKAYVINLSLHLQSYLDRIIENSNLVLVSYNSNDAPNSVILKGTGGSKPKIMLWVTYTEI